MGSEYFTNPLVFLIELAFSLYILLVLLRFLLQLVRADFYNPVSQFIVKATSPVLNPIRRVVPGIGGMDISALLLAWLLKTIELLLIIWITKGTATLLFPLVWALPKLVELTINIFFYGLLIQVVLSWVNPGTYNPVASLLHSLNEPLLAPVRRRLPPVSGLDLSPMLVMVGLILLKMLLMPPLEQMVTRLFT